MNAITTLIDIAGTDYLVALVMGLALLKCALLTIVVINSRDKKAQLTPTHGPDDEVEIEECEPWWV